MKLLDQNNQLKLKKIQFPKSVADCGNLPKIFLKKLNSTKSVLLKYFENINIFIDTVKSW